MSIDEAQVRELVRNVLRRTLGLTDHAAARAAVTHAITERSVADAAPGTELHVTPGSLVTPLAREAARERGVDIVEDRPAPERSARPSAVTGTKTVAIGADHGGYELKQSIAAQLKPPITRTSRWRSPNWSRVAAPGAVSSSTGPESDRAWRLTKCPASAPLYAMIKPRPSTAASTTMRTC